MAIGRGIHVFYISPRKWTGGDGRKSGVNLYWLHMDGTNVLSDKQVDLKKVGLDVDVRYGVSAIMADGWLNLFVTVDDGTLWRISTQDGATYHPQAVPSVKTKQSTAVVRVQGELQVYTNSYSETHRTDCLQCSRFNGEWRSSHPVLDNSGRPIILAGGPCAVTRGEDLVVLYGQNNNSPLTSPTPLKSLLIDARGAISDFSPDDSVLTPNAPGASLLTTEGDLMVIHHGWPLTGKKKDDHLYAAIVDRNNRWRKEIVPPGAWLNDNPAACTFGDRIYAFFQGRNNNLYLQLFMGDRWLPEAVPVATNGAPVREVWYGPAALVV